MIATEGPRERGSRLLASYLSPAILSPTFERVGR